MRTVVLSKYYWLSRGRGQKGREKLDYNQEVMVGGRPLEVAVTDTGWLFFMC